MKRLASLLFPLLLAACATAPGASADFLQKAAGESVFGMVVELADVPNADVLASVACIRRDLACAMTLAQKPDQYATLAVYEGNVLRKVLVPRGMAFAPGDILQVEVSHDPDVPATYRLIGARSAQRGPDCDWVDGSLAQRRGGVACHGWSYRSLR